MNKSKVPAFAMSHKLPRDGQRYVVDRAFEAIVHVQFDAPVSVAEVRLLPQGLHFEIWGDVPNSAHAVPARPIEAERWESVLVSEESRRDELYGEYGLSITLDNLARHCSPI
ncbi:hypothetical protein RB623_17355 [Mesorhizobium sp. LHD-90]|uniref:hypothetical protein n=1 Tax=Mesorhizobium sp. LHD-90 TaxID=3071414 RepID=UPI0027E1B4E8|nr:hypothetical protein [Mesorhizobium sp. LHD-90]MDQ6435826.1 hypothetical protein [Mesorhizobium sp. LHD-90]